MKKDILHYFRLIAFIEGISYLILLFIAMPLKYYYGYDQAVKMVGMTHGILFVLFIFLLGTTTAKYRFSLGFNIVLFVASLVPFGTFYTDRKLGKIAVK